MANTLLFGFVFEMFACNLDFKTFAFGLVPLKLFTTTDGTVASRLTLDAAYSSSLGLLFARQSRCLCFVHQPRYRPAPRHIAGCLGFGGKRPADCDHSVGYIMGLAHIIFNKIK